MDKCCTTNPKMVCLVCNRRACIKHGLRFKQSHPSADKLAPNAREVYYCDNIMVSYYIEEGIVVLMSLDDFTKAIVPNKSL